MLSIGAGAQQQVMAFIEHLGVHNLIVEAREANDPAFQKVREFPGLTVRDLRLIRANCRGSRRVPPASDSCRRSSCRSPSGGAAGIRGRAELSANRGCTSVGPVLHGARRTRRRRGVIGKAAEANLFGARDPIGEASRSTSSGSGDWHVGPQTMKTERGRPAGAGPQQPRSTCR